MHEVQVGGTMFTAGAIVLFPGRFQPPHAGQLDTILRLAQRNSSALLSPNKRDRAIIETLGRLIIAVGPVDRQRMKGDPLTIGERIDLLQEEIRSNKEFDGCRHRIEITYSPGPADWLVSFSNLLTVLPQKPDAVASGNTRIVQFAKDLGIRALVTRRMMAGAEVRKLIALHKLEEARQMLPRFVFARCQERGLFEVIQNIENAQ